MRVFTLLLLSMTSLNAVEHVVLLHGLARTSSAMNKLEKSLVKEGFKVSNIGYPSRKHSIPELCSIVREKIKTQQAKGETTHVVTHSMGGIILRHIQNTNPVDNLRRVVMLSPPNQGSEVVDKLGALWAFKILNGPAGNQLGTSPDGFVCSLGKVDFELGVITGNRSINLILSQLIPGEDDGKVSVENAKVDGMKDFKVVPATHPFIMKKKKVHRDIIAFLRNGKFQD